MSDKNLVDTLLNLDKKKITYVCWKNISELNSSLIGLSDLDLFVPNIYKSKFIDYLESESWIELINPISEYPGIKHFYKLGKNSNFYHIHVYFKLITGNSWIKEYILPFDDWIVENREWNSEYKIWVLNSSSQAYLFIFRHFLKNSSIIGRILYKKNFFFIRRNGNLFIRNLIKKLKALLILKIFIIVRVF